MGGLSDSLVDQQVYYHVFIPILILPSTVAGKGSY